MVSFHEIFSGLRQLGLDKQSPVIIHTSLSSFGEIHGGVETLLGAVLGNFNAIMVPTFTYKTMIIPEEGPSDNAITYGSGHDQNLMAEPYSPNMPADKLMGVFAETVRTRPEAKRSSHPILSFSGINVEAALEAQTPHNPFAPIGVLAEQDGWVMLLGTDQTVNTSIHYAEKLAGRLQFVRWALLSNRVTECGGFPGCSDGFNQIEPVMEDVLRSVQIGGAKVQAIPLQPLIQVVVDLLMKDSQALLCQRPDCERCNAVRQSVHLQEV
ncbi:MAG: AAC(3) family N-acetyltransferase [Anaerolineaceae bacterium]|jgi:aminoglycoside 3-N-acetyltransferase